MLGVTPGVRCIGLFVQHLIGLVGQVRLASESKGRIPHEECNHYPKEYGQVDVKSIDLGSVDD